MLRSSIPLGRFFGVEVRVHISFLLLLAAAIAYSAVFTGNIGRGLSLWFALCFAVLVREIARAIAALYSGLQLRAVLLLPVGGVMAFAPRAPEVTSENPPTTPRANMKIVTATGPLANFAMCLLLLGFSYGLEPGVSLFAQPWISLHHILRSTIWIQFLVGAVNLLPAAAMPTRRFLRTRQVAPPPSLRALAPGVGFNVALAIILMLAGFFLSNVWFIFFGGLMLLWSQLRAGPSLDTVETNSLLVSDVMLTEYTLLSSSDTLRGALTQTAHSLHDVFPVVRGDRLVGSISRDTLATRLQIDGDGYLQGAMNRTLSFAEPSEKLVDALRRVPSFATTGILHVIEDGAVLGILTPQSLARGVQLTRLTRPPQPEQSEP
jgi:CBS domain-containing protein